MTEHLQTRADLAGADHLSSEEIQRLIPSLRRRADAVLAPWMIVMHVGADDLLEVEDQAIAALLELPYRDASLGGRNRDYNLGGRREALGAVRAAGHE